MVPFHRTLFSKKGVSILLNKEGFNKIKFITNNQRNWGWTRGISWKLGYSIYSSSCMVYMVKITSTLTLLPN